MDSKDREPDGQEPVGEEEVKQRWPPGHHYSPVPNTRRLAKRRFQLKVWPPQPHPTPGIDWRGDQQRALCREVFAGQDPPSFPAERTADPTEYWMGNGLYPPLDAWVLQAMLRHLEPRRVIEIGCGYSSLVTARVNRELFGERMKVTCIDPFVRPPLKGGVPGITEIREEEVQETPLEMFEQLDAGDVLFVDTSHTVKTGGEVPWIYNQILPRLRSGVVVHVHDAFLPGDYPKEWVLEGRAWNEIYLLQSFLVFNSGFDVLFGVRWMLQHDRRALAEAFPQLASDDTAAGALWLRRV